MMGVQNIAKSMGWQLLASTPHLGIGNVEPLGNASSCILASPFGDRYGYPFCVENVRGSSQYRLIVELLLSD